MRRILLFAALIMTTCLAYAQHGEMTFVGKSDFHIIMNGTEQGNTTVMSDTIAYDGTNNRFVIPAMKYGTMIIPSFVIEGATQITAGYDGVTWEDNSFTAKVNDNGQEKSITGTALKGEFSHKDGLYRLMLSITFSYGVMPFPISYSIDSYYVKPTSGKVEVMVGGVYGPYIEPTVFDARLYEEDGIKKLDVTMHEYTITGTPVGNITVGQYSVKGLTYDESKEGYYRDYSQDEEKFHLKMVNGGVTTIDGEYGFTQGGIMLVKMNGSTIETAQNNFQPGAMPFPITSVFNSTTDGITNTTVTAPNGKTFDMQGRLIDSKALKSGLYIKNGKKYIIR